MTVIVTVFHFYHQIYGALTNSSLNVFKCLVLLPLLICCRTVALFDSGEWQQNCNCVAFIGQHYRREKSLGKSPRKVLGKPLGRSLGLFPLYAGPLISWEEVMAGSAGTSA